MDQLLANVPLLMLVTCRMIGLTITHPVFPARFMPPQLRIALAVGLGLIVFPVVKSNPEAATGAMLIFASLSELLVGMILGFIGMLLFSVVQMAGGMLDLDMGFGMAQVLDPSSGASSPLLATLFNYIATALFLVFNGHHWVIEGIAQSFTVIPVGRLTITAQAPMMAVMLFSQFLGIALQLVLPVLAALMLTSVGIAVVNRAVPQIQLFSYAMTVKSLLGLVVLILVLPYMMTGMESLFDMGQQQTVRMMELLR